MSYRRVQHDATATNEPMRPRFTCVVNGCPITAAIGVGNGEFICRFHYGTRPDQWPSITRTLRNRLAIVHVMQAALSGDELPDWPSMAYRLAEETGQPELRPDPNRPVLRGTRDERLFPRLYGQRIDALLQRACVDATDRKVQRKQSADIIHDDEETTL